MEHPGFLSDRTPVNLSASMQSANQLLQSPGCPNNNPNKHKNYIFLSFPINSSVNPNDANYAENQR